MSKQLIASIDRFARIYGCRSQLTRYAKEEGLRLPDSKINESELSNDDSDTCPDCGEEYTSTNLPVDIHDSHGQTHSVCGNCALGGDYSSCQGCFARMSNDDIEDGYCPLCRESEEDTRSSSEDRDEDDENEKEDLSDVIHPYLYKPDMMVFHEDEGDEDKRHYGVELETILKKGELRDEAGHTLNLLNDFQDNEDFAYLKEDPSLEKEAISNGYAGSFEIVTHPATLPIQKEQWAKFFKRKPSGLLGKDAVSTGLHIHVERKDLGDLAIGKILAFVNSADNKDFITNIAGRESEEYAELNPDKAVTDARKSQRSRYEAVNLRNKDTVEFRIFKGTMDKDEFMSRLEFVDALTSYIKSDLPSIREVMGKKGVSGLAGYVARNRKTYPHFYEFMKKNGHITAPSKEKMAKMMAVKVQHVPMQVSISYAYKHKDSAKPEHNIIYRLAQLKA